MANEIPIDQLTNFGSSLTIEELGSAGPNYQPRRVILLGPALPFQGAEWGFENQVLTTWYPGNGTEATQQMLGPRELPSTWEGKWRRTLMGKLPSIYYDETGAERKIVSPGLLRDILEDIFRAGLRLRVTWNVSGNVVIGNPKDTRNRVDDRYQIVREGRVKAFKTPIERHTDIGWNMEFHWMSRGGRIDKIASVRGDEDLKKISAALEASVIATENETNSKIVSVDKRVRSSANNFTLGQLENVLGTPLLATKAYTRKMQVAVNDIKRVGNIATKLQSAPSAIASTIVDFGRNTSAVSNKYQDELGRQPAEVSTKKPTVSAMLRSTKYFAEQAFAAALNARRGYEIDRSMRRMLVAGANRGEISVRESSSTRAGDIISIYITKTGDTPQKISVAFYKNPDEGAAILRSNRMPLYTPFFRPGTILIIPTLTNKSAQNTNAV